MGNGVGSSMDSDFSHEWMHGGIIEENVPSYTLIRLRIENIFKTTAKYKKNPTLSWAVSRAGDTRKSITVTEKTGDIHNCWGSTVVDVIYPTISITAKQKS